MRENEGSGYHSPKANPGYGIEESRISPLAQRQGSDEEVANKQDNPILAKPPNDDKLPRIYAEEALYTGRRIVLSRSGKSPIERELEQIAQDLLAITMRFTKLKNHILGVDSLSSNDEQELEEESGNNESK